MLRLVLPLLAGTACAWILLYGTPPEWQGRIWNEVKKWLSVVTAVAISLCIVSLVLLIFQQ